MFDSLRIDERLLSDDARQSYRAALCAGCHALHGLAGRPASLLTNYEHAVLGPARASSSARSLAAACASSV